ncbi:MAG: 2-isopropylmalate synthase [Nanoarchaeota archaeon]|nr:2-isopropylmalate synthase [Nanoarchaeota archaeon]
MSDEIDTNAKNSNMIYPTNMGKDDIIIFDTTLRDGEQSEGCGMKPSEKERIARALIKANVNVIEAGFPTSTDRDFANVKKTADMCSTQGSPAVAGLSITTLDSVVRTYEAIDSAFMPCMHIFCATSPIHMEKKLKKSPSEVYDMVVSSVAKAKSIMNKGYIEFSAEDATRTEPDFLCSIVEAAIDAGASVINLPDTVGFATMREFSNMIKNVQDNVKNIDKAVLSVHCHNDNGLALANTLNAIELGVKQIETTASGIGERAGNLPLHLLVFQLISYKMQYNKKICLDQKQVGPLTYLVSEIVGIPIPPKEPVIGSRVMMHGAGIHWDGARKNKLTYEPFDQKDFGVYVTDMAELGPRCGKAGVQTCLEQIGYSLDDSHIKKTTERVKFYADAIKSVSLETLKAIVDCEITADGPFVFSDAQYGRDSKVARATVSIFKTFNGDKTVISETSEGDGTVNAICKAINKATGIDAKLEKHNTKALGKGSDTVGYVEVKVMFNGDGYTYTGKGMDFDLNIASAKAYVNAINQIVNK